MSRVQGLLSAAKPEDVTIEQLLRMELDAVAFARDNEKVILSGPHVILPEDVLRTLALALHELVTNAVKHGALNTENGQLRIKWDVLQRDGARRLRLDWLETGVNTRRDNSIPVNHGFGRSLIEIALPQQFGAKTLYTWEDGAVHCCIDIPLARENA